jgi:hypothetical protein
LSPEHPLVAEGWLCSECQDEFDPSDVGLVMPFHGSEGSVWLAVHRSCVMRNMGLAPIDDVTEVAAHLRKHADSDD